MGELKNIFKNGQICIYTKRQLMMVMIIYYYRNEEVSNENSIF